MQISVLLLLSVRVDVVHSERCIDHFECKADKTAKYFHFEVSVPCCYISHLAALQLKPAPLYSDSVCNGVVSKIFIQSESAISHSVRLQIPSIIVVLKEKYLTYTFGFLSVFQVVKEVDPPWKPGEKQSFAFKVASCMIHWNIASMIKEKLCKLLQVEVLNSRRLSYWEGYSFLVKVHIHSGCSVLVQHWTVQLCLKGEHETGAISRPCTVALIIILSHVYLFSGGTKE